ncbi:MAG TPA: DUF362 domain-containing protein [Terriglobia bacterium]|nr:DUF362 domain-containing protein [Terriglobia bacterium]
MMPNTCSRRKFVGTLGAAAGVWLARPVLGWARPTPAGSAGRVAIGKCHEYGPQVAEALASLFDQLGGLDGLVRGKTVAIKLNLTGGPDNRLGQTPPELTHWVHPDVVAATVHLLGKAGAQRIRVLESPMGTAQPLEEFMLQAKWDPHDFLSAAPRVEFENTNCLGQGKKYSRLWVPGGGLMFNGYDLNHSYEDCDVFVSVAKLKEHSTAGVTLSIKNCFGITPCTIYGQGAGQDEPSLVPKGGRAMLHDGKRLPSKSAPSPLAAYSSKDPGFRVPRVTADLVAARPIHLAVIDGIHTMTAGEGPWTGRNKPVQPGVLVAGTNCVATDAVCTALMGFDPMADRGTAPFEKCDSTLKLAEQLGLGTRDLNRIEVLGTPIAEARMNFRSV